MKAKVKERTRNGMKEPQSLLQRITPQDGQAGVVVDENNLLQIFYFQSSHMTKIFDSFPEMCSLMEHTMLTVMVCHCIVL